MIRRLVYGVGATMFVLGSLAVAFVSVWVARFERKPPRVWVGEHGEEIRW